MCIHLEKLLSPVLFSSFIFLSIACDGSGSDVFPLFPATINSNQEDGTCLILPENVRLQSSTTENSYSCSVSGLTYECVHSESGIIDSRKFISIEVAKLGPIDPPFFHLLMVASHRGIESAKSTNPSEGTSNYSYSYDSENRLVSSYDESVSSTQYYNDYNTQGFPRNGGNYSYTFGFGQTRRPSKIAMTNLEIDYDQNGWATNVLYAPEGEYSVTNTGSLSICPE